MYRSTQYLRWIAAAEQLFVMNKPKGLIQQLEGPFVALLELRRPDKRRRDSDNLMKVPLDFASRLGLIEDDSNALWNLSGWTADPERAPYGARLTLLPCLKNQGLPEILTGLIASLATDSREKT